MRTLLLLVAIASPGSPALAQGLTAQLVVDGLANPTHLSAPSGDPRLFVATNDGRIWIVENGAVLGMPFLDLSAEVHPSEGLASIAFHPDYSQNGRFFVSFQATGRENHLREYQVSGDPNVADPGTATEVLPPEDKDVSIHNWNHALFGPDGLLYLAVGDGVAVGDDVENPAQDLATTRGKLLRLDVDAPPPYVPLDNPFVGVSGARIEVWALGLRNPWRVAFDPFTDDLWITDVGKANFEEISHVAGGDAAGMDFGWRCVEGSTCTGHAGCAACPQPAFVDPLRIYRHEDGRCAIIGGAVFQGASAPTLHGKFFFADYCSGEVWSLRASNGVVSDLVDHTAELAAGGASISVPTSFGVDGFGELYVLDQAGGEVWKLVPGCGTFEPYCEATANSSGVPATLGGSGSLVVADNALHLQGHDLPAGEFGYFVMSVAQGFVPLFGGGAGNLCLGPPLKRFAQDVLSIPADGTVDFQPDLGNLPQNTVFAPGDAWHFQLWFRDHDPAPTSNTTPGVRVTFCN